MAVASPTTTQPIEVKKVDDSNNAAAAPKKRRRRAPATGATEDCFSCKKRSIKCDRRRPYCGQCVEIGKECTGYRTTLTWGVGVASRGKLRGMSLPIVKSPSTTTATRKESTSSASGTTVANNAGHHSTSFNSRASADFGIHSPTSPMSPASIYSAPQEYQYFGPTSPIPIPSPSTPLGFHMQSPGDHFDMMHSFASKVRRPSQLSRGPLQRLHTSIHLPFDEGGLSASTASLGTYSDSDFPSPGEYPHTPADEFPFADPSIPRYSPMHSYDQAPMGSMDGFFHEAPRSLPMADDMSSSVSSDQSLQDYVEANSAQQNMGPIVFHDVFAEGDVSSSYTALPQPAFSFLPSEESCHRFAPFPTDAIPYGLLRQIYMPGTGGF